MAQGRGKAGKVGRGQMKPWGLLFTTSLWPLSLFLLWDFNLSGIGWEGNEAGQDFWSVRDGVCSVPEPSRDRQSRTYWWAARMGCWGGDCHWLQVTMGQCWSGSGESEDLGAAEDAPQTLGKEGNFGICWNKTKVRGQGGGGCTTQSALVHGLSIRAHAFPWGQNSSMLVPSL